MSRSTITDPMTTDPTTSDRADSPGGGAAAPAQSAEARQRQIRRGRLKMLAILLVCAAPVIASYFTYYVIRPEGRTNYGTLLDPLREVGNFAGTGLDGAPAGLAQLKGRWVLVTGGDADCDAACENRLYLMRQVRLTTGKDRDRVERAWVVAPDAVPSAKLLGEHEGMIVIRADPGAMAAAGFIAAEGARPQDHIWIVDPLGNLVLRYPVAPDPSRMKKDLLKLLKASRIG
jgi:hypothetical protein